MKDAELLALELKDLLNVKLKNGAYMIRKEHIHTIIKAELMLLKMKDLL